MLDGMVFWPDDFARRYREAGVWRGIPLGEALEDSARRHTSHIAIVDDVGRYSFQELWGRARRLASSLIKLGVADGVRVIFQLPNTVEFAIAYLACVKVGAIPVACLPHHRDAEVRALAQLADARAWVFPATFRAFDYREMAERLAPSLPGLTERIVVGEAAPHMRSFDELVRAGQAEDPEIDRHVPSPSTAAVLQLSGGTTGIPKLIPRTHDDYLLNSVAFADASSFTQDDIMLVALPIAHNFPLACPGLQGALLAGATCVLAQSGSPDVVLPLIAKERVTWVPAVPAMLMQWMEAMKHASYPVDSLRAIYVGGQRLNPEVAEAAIRIFGPVVRQCFGMAEGLLCGTRASDPPETHVVAQGRPVSPLDELRIVDESDREVPEGEMGELLCRGPYTIRGYFRAPEHNSRAFTEDGFYRTGDMVRRLPSGDLVVEGRRKDLINRAGEKISAEEVENLCLKHQSVANVALVAMPDPLLGERACACVVLKEGHSLTLTELVRFLREEERIASFKLPERLELFDALPMTGVGKVSKVELRRVVQGRLAQSSS